MQPATVLSKVSVHFQSGCSTLATALEYSWWSQEGVIRGTISCCRPGTSHVPLVHTGAKV